MLIFDRKDLPDIEPRLPESTGDDTLTWKSVAQTHVGNVRMKNEDAFLNATEQGVWIVADGMGGHIRGDKASQAVVKAMQGFKPLNTVSENLVELDQRFQAAHDACRHMYQKKVLGSTVAAFFALGQVGCFVWVGDSRIYRWRDGVIQQVTVDHTVAQQKLARGELTAEQALVDASAHILTRAIGVHRRVEFQMACATVQRGDRYLLCSDGLYAGVTRQEMQDSLGKGPIESVLPEMMLKALAADGRDNITAILLDVV